MRAYNNTKAFAPRSALLFKTCPRLVHLHVSRLHGVTCKGSEYNRQELSRLLYQYEMV